MTATDLEQLQQLKLI